MLIVKVYENTTQIDEIQIHNETGGENSVYHVEGYPELGKIHHKRSSGYRPLLYKVLRSMNAQEILESGDVTSKD